MNYSCVDMKLITLLNFFKMEIYGKYSQRFIFFNCSLLLYLFTYIESAQYKDYFSIKIYNNSIRLTMFEIIQLFRKILN